MSAALERSETGHSLITITRNLSVSRSCYQVVLKLNGPLPIIATISLSQTIKVTNLFALNSIQNGME